MHKRYHEWGYHWNTDRQINHLTVSQKENIAIAAQAEAYIREQVQNQHSTGGGGSLSDRYNQTGDITREFQ